MSIFGFKYLDAGNSCPGLRGPNWELDGCLSGTGELRLHYSFVCKCCPASCGFTDSNRRMWFSKKIFFFLLKWCFICVLVHGVYHLYHCPLNSGAAALAPVIEVGPLSSCVCVCFDTLGWSVGYSCVWFFSFSLLYTYTYFVHTEYRPSGFNLLCKMGPGPFPYAVFPVVLQPSAPAAKDSGGAVVGDGLAGLPPDRWVLWQLPGGTSCSPGHVLCPLWVIQHVQNKTKGGSKGKKALPISVKVINQLQGNIFHFSLFTGSLWFLLCITRDSWCSLTEALDCLCSVQNGSSHLHFNQY